jgi:Prion-inhibition and propagation
LGYARLTKNTQGYQLFLDAEGMPEAYQHLRVRLRIEQTRLLHWGEKVGLLEKVLESPSRTLQLHRNLILDIMLEIQALFRSCVEIDDKYDSLIPLKPLPSETITEAIEDKFERRFPKGTNTILTKVLGVLEKTPQVPKRLEWAIVKQKEFKGLIEKLIGYNDYMEALLDRNALDSLQSIQRETHLVMLQLNSKVNELKEISLAMQVKTQVPTPLTPMSMGIRRSFTVTAAQDDENASFARLADFKASQTIIEHSHKAADWSNGTPVQKLKPLEKGDITFKTFGSPRCEAIYQGKHIWIEWKEHTLENEAEPNWSSIIGDRVRKLATLLSLTQKPPQFRAPHCVGYFDDRSAKPFKYGFMYEKPAGVPPETKPESLLDLFKRDEMPSLTKRVILAHAIAQCLMYLHSVNWLHKGFRSDNIVFFRPNASDEPAYAGPIVSGFDYARPDSPGEATEPPVRMTNNDVYRHPSTLTSVTGRARSVKAHDIYSLGIVLVEIAAWKQVSDIIALPQDNPKAAKSMVLKVQKTLLADSAMKDIERLAGETYRDVVRRCLAWDEDEELENEKDGQGVADANVGANIQREFFKEVVSKLGSIRL